MEPYWGRHSGFALLLCAAVGGGSLLGGGCEHRSHSGETDRERSAQGPTPTHVSWDADFGMSEQGRARAVLRARRMEQYQTSDSTYSVWRSMEDTARVRVYLFDERGDSSATVTADSLVFQDQKGVLDAYRNVVVTTEDNKRLESEHLTWHQANRTIRTRRFVRIRTPSEVVQGDGLVADEDLETYQIGRFSAEVDVNEDDDGEDEQS
ncbi:LPS export ABC transporter periplasmic protein LptC [Salinibacter altiplanensis]|uniref:LPS export ABC transporter periplasmic protein LptC n=1 Tax=Salinibacter altiplanensis TaxID=1803181 RepID=UPI000C9F1A64|nr:LPS export ABC transporter periplasmic protein LptC [Salinibacter altiplanensis]